MNLLLFLITVIVSFISVRIGAIAFELTGLEWSLAKFQALSCFTGTGFTTKEAELVVGHTQRRRIASVLMVLGNAGLVTLMATFANSLRPRINVPKINIPFLDMVFPAYLLPWMNLIIIFIILYLLYRLYTHTKFVKQFTAYLREHIVKKDIIKPVSFEELLVSTAGYGVSSLEICPKSPILNKKISEAGLRKYSINLLAVERNGEVLTNPSPDTQIILGDKVIFFGRLEDIRKTVCPAE